MEFSEPSLVAHALLLNESVLHERNLKVDMLNPIFYSSWLIIMRLQVTPKRTNLPGMAGRGRGRGRGRGGFGGRGAPRGGGYRGGYRGRGRGFTPY